MLPHIEKTIRFLSKSSNPSSIDPLRFLLDHVDRDVREKAFEGLYLKKKPEILLELFHLIARDEQRWLNSGFLSTERLSRLVEQAIRSDNFELVRQGCDMAVRNKLYETLPAVISLLDVPKAEWVDLSARVMLELAECFYNELAAATSPLERRNMDRRREWFAVQLEDPVRRYPIHRRIEAIKAFLLVTKKNFPFLLTVLADVHSQVCKTIIELMQNNEESGYYRLLLGFVDDSGAPPIIDLVLTSKEDPKFVRNLLKMIGNNPNQTMKDALKRFKQFHWIRSDNEAIPELIAGEEPAFVQLVANANLTRETTLPMFRLVFALPSTEGRRLAVKAIRAFSGDDVNRILLVAGDDPDPVVCSEVLRIMKARRLREFDQLVMRNYANSSEMVRKTIYDLVPEFRIENFFKKIDQVSDDTAQSLGRIIRNIDPDARKRINTEIASVVPIRRRIAIDAMRFMKLAPEYEETLIDIFENDDEIEVRIAACMALSQVLTIASYQSLQRAVESHNMNLQRAGIEATELWRNALEQLQQETSAFSAGVSVPATISTLSRRL